MNAHVHGVIHAGTGSSAGAPLRHLHPAARHRAARPVGQRAQLASERQVVARGRRRRSPATARQPKCVSMNGVSQFQARATISTGGAAKCVSVPPIETFTNSRPSVAYFSRVLGCQIVELPREQQRADRHRRRLGDERAEQRPDGEDRHPPGRRRAAAEAGHAAQRAFGEARRSDASTPAP